jgi:Tol biopolymer transport system component
VAVSAAESGRRNIWIHDAERGTKWPLTADSPSDSQPAWAPSGETVFFTSLGRTSGGRHSVFALPVDGNSAPTLLVDLEARSFEADVSRDGRHLVFATFEGDVEGGSGSENYDIWHLRLSADAEPASLIATPAHELLPVLAPDGRHVAFMSDRTGRFEIYVSSYPGAKRTWGPISTDGGTQPKWSARGELFYVDSEGLMSVKIDASSGFSWASPERIFTEEEVGAPLVDPSQVPFRIRYAVADDGERFVVVRNLAGPDLGITVVQNWLAEFNE